NITGSAEVREVFKISGVGTVAGCYVTNGKVVRSGKVRIYRNNISVYDGNILALKRFKDDVKEVAYGFECGISVENYNDIKVGDIFEIYQMEEIAQ
ncbi:MAG: translation initiation factor IF-2, partial [Clostridia bacterium]|nr:translation initiation factor IF-2 [Clostridia bacterium]